jgi:hypothetical protein
MDQSLKQLFNPLLNAFKQHSATIITVTVAILIGVAVVRLYQIVITSTERGVEGYTATSKADNNFNKKIIDRVNNLRTITDSNAPLDFPNRPSPFVE